MGKGLESLQTIAQESSPRPRFPKADIDSGEEDFTTARLVYDLE